jgi:hypothetical protein
MDETQFLLRLTQRRQQSSRVLQAQLNAEYLGLIKPIESFCVIHADQASRQPI